MNNIYRDYTAMCPEFRQGIACLAEGEQEKALDAFARADARSCSDAVYKNKYQSFHGLLLLRSGQFQGIELCRSAAAQEYFDADVFYNLARAELEIGHRREALQVIRYGLDVDVTHPDLIRLRQRLGVRRKVMLSFLGRDNPLNRLIGKFTYGNSSRSLV